MIFRIKIVILALGTLILTLFTGFAPQEAKVNQKKIDREREKKEKEAAKDYEKAVKRHYSNQSKSTKKSMKRTKKESRNATPVKR